MLAGMIGKPRLRSAPLFALGATLLACSGHSSTTEEADGGAKHDARAAGDAETDGNAVDAAVPGLALITEPDQGMTPIYALMMSAKKTLDMTMYEDDDTMATSILTAAAKSGVTVRVILDINREMSSNATTYANLNTGGVQAHWANTTYAATHQKTITVDGTTSAIMTLNLTPEYYSTSREFVVVDSDKADVAAIEATFAADFASAAITPNNGDDLVWSPTNAQSSLLDLINGATTSLIVENEEMDYTPAISALAAAAKKGVDVKVVMTADKEYDGAFTELEGAGVKVVTYARDASLYIHAKVILADYGKPTASVFIGSENFSNASLNENRELGIITTNSAILTSVNTTLSSDFAGGTAY